MLLYGLLHFARKIPLAWRLLIVAVVLGVLIVGAVANQIETGSWDGHPTTTTVVTP
jgi:hypothetical protein